MIHECALRLVLLRLIEQAATDQHTARTEETMLELGQIDALLRVGNHFRVLDQHDLDIVRELIVWRGSLRRQACEHANIGARER